MIIETTRYISEKGFILPKRDRQVLIFDMSRLFMFFECKVAINKGVY